jgi:DHA1 family multidrug resistance protein-like MFS transporter
MATADEHEGRPGWRRGVALVAAAQLLSMMGFSCAISFLPLFIQTLGIDSPARAVAWAGSLNFAQGIMVALCSPLWGSIADRYGAKPMVCRALLGGGAVLVVISFVGRVEFLFALFLLLGCFTGVNTAVVTLVSGLAPRESIGAAIGACQTGVFVGIAIGPTVGGILADTFSYRIGIRGGAVLLLLSGLLVLLGIGAPPRGTRVVERRPGLVESLRAAGRSRPLMLLIGLIFLVQFSLQMISPVLPIYVQSLAPDATRVATIVGVVLGVGGVTSALGALFCGRLADRLGRRRLLAWMTAGGALALGGQALIAGIGPLIALRGLAGFFTGGLSVGTNTAVGTMVPEESRGAAFGISGSAFSLGNAFGPLLGGLLAGGLGPRPVIGLAALTLLGGWAIVRALGGTAARQGTPAEQRVSAGRDGGAR